MSKVRFGDILYIKGRIGWQALGKDEYLSCGDYYLVTGVDITNENRINFKQCYYVTKERYEMDPNIQLKNGDIIVTKDGTIGKIGIIENLDKPATLNSHLFLIRNLRPDILDNGFLFYILKSDYFQKFATNNTSGSNIPAFTQANIENFTIELPPIKEQRAIAKTVEDIDFKIRNNNAICYELEAMAALIYNYWFVQFDFPDENGKPYKSSGGKMVYNEELKRDMPEGWEVKPLRGLYEIERGISYTSDDIASGLGVPMINLACVGRDRNYRDGELKYHGGIVPDEAYLNPGEMLIACTDLTRERAIIGCPILVPDDGNKYTYSMDIAKITFDKAEINNWYMYMALRTDFYHNYIKAWASGTNVLHLNLEGLDWYKTYFPPMDLQNRFANIINSVHLKKSMVLSGNRELASLRDFLLPMMMNGQVKVDKSRSKKNDRC